MTLPEPINVGLHDFARAFRFGEHPVFNFRILSPKFKNLRKPTKEDLEPFEKTKVPYFAWLQEQCEPYGVDSRPFKVDLEIDRLKDSKLQALRNIQRTNEEASARCPYFVVNQGGQKKDEIAKFTAFFCEWDDIPLEEQWSKVMALPIAPHIVIKTRSSLHCYWLADEETTADEWLTVQRSLIVMGNSDLSICDLSRVMRLPGFDHTVFDFEAGETTRVPVTALKFDTAERLSARALLEMVETTGQSAVSKDEWVAYVKARKAASRQAAGKDPAEKAPPIWEGEAPAELKARYEAILEKLDLAGTAFDDSVRATCPGCHDPNPSLIITLASEKILFHDFAGCTFEEICAGGGWSQGDCYAQKKSEQGKADDGPTIAQTLIDLALTNSELFHDAGGDCFASVNVNGHRETHKLGARDYKDWLAGLLYKTTERAAGGDKLGEAVTVLRAKARYEAEEIETHVRIAEHEGAIYLDLCDKEWRQVKITEQEWQIVASIDSPIRFRRAGGMLALPDPIRGGELCELRELLNLPPEDTDNWPVLLGWLVATFKPCNVTRIAYPLLAIHGEQGSAKSTTARLLRRLIDPNKADLRASAKDERDLAIAAEHGRVLAFDNLTYLSDSLSNALCRLATGGGFATRELFTDEGEVIFDSQRPVILNGIAEVVTKSDLLDRSILIYLPRIDRKKRKLDRVIDRDFAKAQPRVLGALLDAVSKGLKRLAEGVDLDELPRMADFAEWATACEPGLGLGNGQFLKAYRSNQEKANGLAIEASPVAQEIIAFIGDCHEWTGTTGGLIKALDGRLTAREDSPKKKNGWPQSARALGAKLKESAPNLRRNGVEITFGERGSRGYTVTLAEVRDNGKHVHDVHDVHTANARNGLGREHVREHVGNEQSEMFTAKAAAATSEHVGNGISGNVHTNVHSVNGSKQKASEHREHREHVFVDTRPEWQQQTEPLGKDGQPMPF